MQTDKLKYFDNKTPFFSLNDIKTYARVADVTDGDTIVLIIPILGDNYYKFHVRINGIDTCETRSDDICIKEQGLKAKYRTIELLSNKNIKDIIGITKNQIKHLFDNLLSLVWIECFDFDKYGRLLCNIFIDNKKNLADILIEEKLAYKYDGTTKLSEIEQKQILGI